MGLEGSAIFSSRRLINPKISLFFSLSLSIILSLLHVQSEMGSGNSGEIRFGNGRSGSIRRGKKSGGATDKPKQPQRGMGVAQLEKIRLHNQFTAGYHPSLHGPLYSNLYNKEDDMMRLGFAFSPPTSSSSTVSSYSVFGLRSNFMMGFGEMDRRDVRYIEPHSSANYGIPSHSRNTVQDPYCFAQPTQSSTVALPLPSQPSEDWVLKRKQHDRGDSIGSSSRNSDSSDAHEIDLDLKLSL